MAQNSSDESKEVILEEEQFSWLYYDWWHSSVPPFQFALFLSQAVKEKPDDFVLNAEQRQAIARIEVNFRKVLNNWSYIPDHSWPNTGVDQVYLEFFTDFWQEGLLPIENALAEANALLGGEFGKLEIDDDVATFLRRGSYEILADWRLPLDYISLRHNFEKVWTLEAADLNKAIQETVNLLIKHRVLENVNVSLPSDLRQVTGNSWLNRAISYLIPFPKYASFRGDARRIFNDDYSFLNSELPQREVDHIPTIEVELKEQASLALVKIHVGLVSKRSRQGKLPLNTRPFRKGTFPSVAGLIIEGLDSQATFSWSDLGSTFQFGLPLWPERDQLAES